MKKKYKVPEIRMINIEFANIIATSGDSRFNTGIGIETYQEEHITF